MTESKIQQTFCDFLSAHRILFFAPLNETSMAIMKMFNIPMKTRSKVVNYYKKMGLLPGIPDIVILHKGTCYFVELKTDTGKVSEQQGIIHTALSDRGFTVGVAYGLEDAINLCVEWGVV